MQAGLQSSRLDRPGPCHGSELQSSGLDGPGKEELTGKMQMQKGPVVAVYFVPVSNDSGCFKEKN